MMNRRAFLTLSVAGFLTGCGFRLRGTGPAMGKLPDSLKIQTTDPYAPMIQNITRQLNDQGTDVVTSGSVPTLTLSLPVLTDRVLGPVSGGDQTELALEITYRLVSEDLVYVDGGADTSAEDQRVAQLKRSLEEDLLRQIVPSIRVRYEQALKQTDTPKAD